MMPSGNLTPRAVLCKRNGLYFGDKPVWLPTDFAGCADYAARG
jgi:hypothetical protein